MKKNIKIILLVTGLGALGLLLYFKKFKPTKSDESDESNGRLDDGSGGGNQLELTKYRVTTRSSPLNLREAPNTNSKIIKTYPKNTELLGQPSSNGWVLVYEYKGDYSPVGYVSMQYLTEIE